MSRKIGDKTYLSPSEVAERMGVSLRTVQRWVSRGGVISSPWLDPATARRRTWHRTRPVPEATKESAEAAGHALSSDARAHFLAERVSALRESARIRHAAWRGEIRLSFITDPSSGFHYFPEDEVMNLVKHLTDEGSDFWRVTRAIEAVEWREKHDALRQRAAAETSKPESDEKQPTGRGGETGREEASKRPRPDEPSK